MSDTYILYGEQLFESDTEVNTHLPSDATKDKFSTILSIVSDLTNFKKNTKIQYLLQTDFTANSDIANRIQTYYTSTTKHDCILDGDAYLFNWNASNPMPTQLATTILSSLEQDLNDMPALSHGTSNSKYKMVMRNVCKHIFLHHYPILQGNNQLLQSTTSTMLSDYVTLLCAHIESNANRESRRFDTRCDSGNDTYFKSVYDQTMKYKNANIPQDMRKIFLFCFYPYFAFEFILNNVAQKNNTSAETAPRLYMFHRIAVLAVYIFLFHLMMTLLETMQPGQANTYKAFSILSKLNDEMFKREQINTSNILNNTTKNTKTLSDKLQKQNVDVAATRSNVTKAAIYEQRIKSRLTMSIVVMYLWLILTVLTIVGCIVSTFVVGIKDEYTYMCIAVVLIVITATAMYNLLRDK